MMCLPTYLVELNGGTLKESIKVDFGKQSYPCLPSKGDRLNIEGVEYKVIEGSITTGKLMGISPITFAGMVQDEPEHAIYVVRD